MKGRIPSAAAMIAICAGGSAPAQTVIGSFGRWTAYTQKYHSGLVCIAESLPIASKQSRAIARGTVAFFVADFPVNGIHNEPKTLLGYSVAGKERVTASVDGKSRFAMLTQNGTAGIENPATASDLVRAMRLGHRMVVIGKSRAGATISDFYSLNGVTAALREIGKACS